MKQTCNKKYSIIVYIHLPQLTQTHIIYTHYKPHLLECTYTYTLSTNSVFLSLTYIYISYYTYTYIPSSIHTNPHVCITPSSSYTDGHTSLTLKHMYLLPHTHTDTTSHTTNPLLLINTYTAHLLDILTLFHILNHTYSPFSI